MPYLHEPPIVIFALILGFVCKLDSIRFPSSDALSSLGPCGSVLYLMGYELTSQSLSIRFDTLYGPNRGVTGWMLDKL